VLATAQGAPVTWTTAPTPTTSEASIIIPAGGTIYHAGTWGTGGSSGPLSVPVPGDTLVFENMTTGDTIGVLSGIASGGEFASADVWISTGTVDTNFQNVMDGACVDGANPKVLRVGGLVVGKQYRLQVFVSDDRSCCSGRTMELSDNAIDGAGTETASFTAGDSITAVASFTADATTQAIYVRGLAQTQNYVNAYVLVDMSTDTDGDKIPDHIEDTYPFLSSANPADAALDQDGDGLSNLQEYRKRLNLNGADMDGDGLTDGQEVNTYFTNPRVADSDGDTLSDGAEVNTYHSNPLVLDSDGDLFPDRWEAQAGTQLNSNTSTPGGLKLTILGTTPANLLGFDLTDPENDGNDATGTGFNWVNIFSTEGPAPSTATEATGGNVFDNKTGGGEAKWCCNGGQQQVTVEFGAYTALQQFTITSSNDAQERDPRVWEIQGSNDNIHFAPIARFDFTPAQIWTARNQVIKVELPSASLPYKFIRYQVYTTGSANHALGEIEYFGSQNNNDGDGDGIPQLFEVKFPAFLSDGNPADAAADQDNDGLTNLQEFQLGTDMQNRDTDNDGLDDGPEITLTTDPFKADTDGDGLSDGAEVNPPVGVPATDPKDADSDDDYFRDSYEVQRGSDPNSADSGPDGLSVTPVAGLLRSDFTDRQNDGNDATLTGSGFDWVSITASSKADFNPAEGAFNVFDNKVGGGEAKWCCDGAPQTITVQMPFGIRLTHFTLTSSNDSPERDPRVWAIQGSNDGVNFTNIVNHTDASTLFWGATRNQTMRFDLAAPAPVYTWFRYSVTATNGGTHALAEIEYFGNDVDTDNDGLPDYFEAQYSVTDPSLDADTDGLTNLEEYQNHTVPTDSDTDDDGLTDGAEVNTHNSNPVARDSDNDQIPDGYEVAHGGNPTDAGVIPTFAPIDWGTPANITGALSDFKTTGTLVHAWTGNATAINVPGVANFTPGVFLGDRFVGYDPYTRPGSNADYETLLNSGTYNGANGRYVELTNLVVGQDYRVQIWVVDTRAGTADRVFRFGNILDERASLEAGANGNEVNKPGQWVTGTFTAIDTTQYIFMDAPSMPGNQLNAMTVYQEDLAAPLVITAVVRNGAALDITVTGFETTKSYQLMRSTTLEAGSFTPVGSPFTPSNTTQVVSDPAAPAGRAFYRIQDVP